MNTKTFYIDIDKNRFISEQGGMLTEWPTIAYGACPNWTIRFVRPDTMGNLQPIDVTEATAWHAAVDVDFNKNTQPMIRTLDADIDKSQAASGILQLPLNANTETFEQKIGNRNSLQAYFEIRGYDTSGYVIYDYRMNIYALGAVDPQGAEPLPLPSGYATEDWTMAVLRAAPEYQFSEDGETDWHETRTAADSYYRTRYPEGQWSESILIVNGQTVIPELSAYATKEYVDSSISSFVTSSYVDDAVSTKQDVIDNNNKLDYSYISGTPSIPTVNNGTLTIKQGSSTWTFSANSSSNVQVELAEGGGGGSDPNALTGVTLNGTPGTVTNKVAALTLDTSSFVTSSYVDDAVSTKQDVIDSNNKLDYSYISGAPVVNDGILTIKQGGTTKGTFSANTSGNVEIDLDEGGGAGLDPWMKAHLAYQDKNTDFGSYLIPGGTYAPLVSSAYNLGSPIFFRDPSYVKQGVGQSYYPSNEHMASAKVGHMYRPAYTQVIDTQEISPAQSGNFSYFNNIINTADLGEVQSWFKQHQSLEYRDGAAFYIVYVEGETGGSSTEMNSYLICFKNSDGDGSNPFPQDGGDTVMGTIVSAYLSPALSNRRFWYDGLGQEAFQAVYDDEDDLWVIGPCGRLSNRYTDDQFIWEQAQWKNSGMAYVGTVSGVSETNTVWNAHGIDWGAAGWSWNDPQQGSITLSGGVYDEVIEEAWSSQDISPWRNVYEIAPTISGWLRSVLMGLKPGTTSSYFYWQKDNSYNPVYPASSTISSFTATQGDSIHYPEVPVIGAWIDNAVLGSGPDIEVTGLPSGIVIGNISGAMWGDEKYRPGTDPTKMMTWMTLRGQYLEAGQGSIHVKVNAPMNPVIEYDVLYNIQGKAAGGATFSGDYTEFSTMHYEGSFVPTQATVTFKEWVNSATSMRTVSILSGSIHVTGEYYDWEQEQDVTIDEYRTMWLCPVGGMENSYFWDEQPDDAARQALIENEGIHPSYSWGLYENSTAPSNILESYSALGYFPPQTSDTLPILQSASSAWSESAGSWENVTLTVS